MAPIDWVIAAILVFSVLSAVKHGFFIEACSLAGVVLGLLLASWDYDRIMPWVLRAVHNSAVAEALAFLAIALGVMLLAGLVGRMLRWSAQSIGLGWLDRTIGAAFGFLKGCIIVTLGVMAVAAFLPREGWLNDSRLAPYFLTMAHTSSAVTPAEFGARIRQGVRLIRDAQPDWLKPHAEVADRLAKQVS